MQLEASATSPLYRQPSMMPVVSRSSTPLEVHQEVAVPVHAHRSHYARSPRDRLATTVDAMVAAEDNHLASCISRRDGREERIKRRNQ
jgi:hypothetical protein